MKPTSLMLPAVLAAALGCCAEAGAAAARTARPGLVNLGELGPAAGARPEFALYHGEWPGAGPGLSVAYGFAMPAAMPAAMAFDPQGAAWAQAAMPDAGPDAGPTLQRAARPVRVVHAAPEPAPGAVSLLGVVLAVLPLLILQTRRRPYDGTRGWILWSSADSAPASTGLVR